MVSYEKTRKRGQQNSDVEQKRWGGVLSAI
jgi:hypothetical protein